MSTGSITLRAITFAEHLHVLPHRPKHRVAKLVAVEAAEKDVAEREPKQPKTVAYYSPEWWESHHYERR